MPSGRIEYNPITLVRHASWLYPIKGIIYFLLHPNLYPLLRARLLPLFLLSIFVYTLLFTFAYLPQVLFLHIFHGPAAWLNALFLTLGEGSTILSLLFEAFMIDETLVDVFDAVLVDHGLNYKNTRNGSSADRSYLIDLLEPFRQIDTSASTPLLALGSPITKSVYSPFSLRQILEFLLLLPLNFIPYAGVPLFLFLTGYRAGPLHHWRYFQLLDFNKAERKQWIKRRQLKYTWFGMVALTLQLVPGLSMLFLVTSAAGSALWVVRLEGERRGRLGLGGQPGRNDQVYRDDPS